MLRAVSHKYILNFRQPSGTSRGILRVKETWFIKIWDTKNPEVIGWGECGLLRGLSYDDRPGFEEKLAWTCEIIDEIATDFHKLLEEWPAIRFGFEMALTDLNRGGNRILFPSEFTNGEKSLPINGLVWMGDYDFMHQQIDSQIEKRFSVIKLKVGAIDFHSECQLLAYIRKKYSPDNITIRLDANGAFNSGNVFKKLEALSEFQIHSIEQPVAPGQPHLMAEVCRKSPVPVALDEELIGIHSLEGKRNLLEALRPHYIILKPTLLGGFVACNQWIELAEEYGIGWWVTSALESNIGLNAIAQWTATLQNQMPQGLGTGSLYSNNIPSPLEVSNGNLSYFPQKNWDLNVNGLFQAEKTGWNFPITINGQTFSGEKPDNQIRKWVERTSAENIYHKLGGFLQQWYSDDDSVLVTTSGSTGTPRLLSLKKAAMIESARDTGDFLQLQNHGSALLCLSPGFIAGMMMIVRAMLYNQNVIVVNPDGNPLAEIPVDTVPEFAAMVPAQVYNSLINPATSSKLKKIKTLLIGGGEIHPDLEEKLKVFPNAIYATYGMTETISHIAMRRINGKNRKSWYEALPGIKLEVDERGCLVIMAPRISEKPLITNDLVKLYDENRFEWSGRFDNIINRGGDKLIPEEIEKKLTGIIQNRFFLSGVLNIKFGQVPVLIIESEMLSKQEKSRLLNEISQVVSKSEKPVDIYNLGEFVETGSGKINRRATLAKMDLI